MIDSFIWMTWRHPRIEISQGSSTTCPAIPGLRYLSTIYALLAPVLKTFTNIFPPRTAIIYLSIYRTAIYRTPSTHFYEYPRYPVHTTISNPAGSLVYIIVCIVIAYGASSAEARDTDHHSSCSSTFRTFPSVTACQTREHAKQVATIVCHPIPGLPE